MLTAHGQRHRASGCALLWGIAAAFLAMSAGASPAFSTVLVADGRTASKLEPIREGYIEWLRHRMGGAGVSVVPRSVLRQATAARPEAALSERAVMRLAARVGADRAMFVDLRFELGSIDVVLRVYDTADKQIRTAGRALATPITFAVVSDNALAAVLPELGGDKGKLRAAEIRSLDDFAAESRALQHFDRGELTLAWCDLRDIDSPSAHSLRSEIDAAAVSPDVSRYQRARLMAAQGDAEQAWALIASDAARQLQSARPSAESLLAAGEIQRERGITSDALKYYQKGVAADPRNPRAHVGLAAVLSVQRKDGAARRELERALELDSSEPEPWVQLASLEKEDPRRRAKLLIEAGDRAAHRLETTAAQRHFAQARRVDPAAAPVALERVGHVQSLLGEFPEARRSYRGATDTGGPTARRHRNLGRVYRKLDDLPSAQQEYRAALALDPDDAEALRNMGEIDAELGRDAEAMAHLSRAVRLAPSDAGAKRSLARVVHKQGDTDRALGLLREAEQVGEPSVDGLREIAAIQSELGDRGGAQRTLERAADLDPAEPAVQQELAKLYDASGNPEGARRARELAVLLGGSQDVWHGETAPTVARDRYDELLLSFPALAGLSGSVTLLGVREYHADWRERILAWLRPRTLDLAAIGDRVASAISRYYPLVDLPRLSADLGGVADELFAFEDNRSLSAGAIAELNRGLAADAVFLARVVRRPLGGGGCGPGPHVEIALRRLAGSVGHEVGIHANSTCVEGDLETLGSWNWVAGGIYAALVLLSIVPLVRGWGTVVVTVRLPPRTRALFSISVTKRERKVKRRTAGRAKGSARFVKRLRRLSRFEHSLQQGKPNVFRWIPARSKPYYVTMRGPLMDHLTEALIGDFLEERTILVRRGRDNKVEFDMRPKDCPVEICVYRGDQLVKGSQVAVRGAPDSLRYAAQGSTVFHLKQGKHTIVVGARDRVAEREISITKLDPMPLSLDLASEAGLLFHNCPDAVAPYLEGRLDAAAQALEAHGQNDTARRIRATWHQQRGELAEAARELEVLGELSEAAELRASSADVGESARLFERAGEPGRAADVYRESGDLENAARAYEEAYDYENAIDCCRQLGNTEKLIGLLERSSDYFEAGVAAAEAGQPDRAISNLQQVESRHERYTDCCRMLGEILLDHGDTDFALEKFDEVKSQGGLGDLSLETQERYAKLLEEGGRAKDALSVLEEIRRKDVHYGDVSTRIEGLKRQLSQAAAGPGPTGTLGAASEAQESRYEIIEELGRGAMGVVYRARDKHLGRVVALKQLPPNLKDHPSAVHFFEREARSAAVLNHPNIVTVYDAGQENGTYFITMECLEGVPLDAIVKKHGRLAPKMVAKLGFQIATGLDYAHRNKIIHRDIKTANLFFTKERVVKIMDFGLAKMVEEVRRAATVIGGTPYYMAPEQAEGVGVDHRADLYALGVTLFQLATGTYPFDKGDVLYHHKHTQPPDPRERVADIPEEDGGADPEADGQAARGSRSDRGRGGRGAAAHQRGAVAPARISHQVATRSPAKAEPARLLALLSQSVSGAGPVAPGKAGAVEIGDIPRRPSPHAERVAP